MNNFLSTMKKIFNFDFYSLDTIYFTVLILLLTLLIFIRSYAVKKIINLIKKFLTNRNFNISNEYLVSLTAPLKFFIIILFPITVNLLIDFNSLFKSYLDKINMTLISVFIFWFLYQCIFLFTVILKDYEHVLTKEIVIWLSRFIKFLIIFLGGATVLENWGIKVGPIIAGLGLFGVAFALGAQDLFKNLISGIMIIIEKRFKIGDVIEIPGRVLGTVDYIGFRSTIIKKFDSTPLSVPNFVFSDTVLLNHSNRDFRRINWTIGLTYDTSVEQLKSICDEISNYIDKSKEFITNNQFPFFVKVEKFNTSSIDILIQTFTNTNDWDEFLKIKEKLIYEIKIIVENNNSAFAFPSSSIYIENKKNDLPK